MRSIALRVLRAPELITFALLLATLLIGALTASSFLDLNFLLYRTSTVVPVGLLALAMTFVIISGHIDLSVASGAALVLVIVSLLYRDAGVPMGLLVVLAPLIGAGLGLFNGLLVTKLRLPSLVVTLGTLALYRGLAMVLMGEQTVSKFPAWFVGVDLRRVAGLEAVPVLILLACAVVVGVVLARTTFGRRVYAVGTNVDAARFSAIRTDRVLIGVFTLSGVAMGLAALLQLSMTGSGSYKLFSGQDSELTAITAVVLGGTSIAGGRGGILGTVLAVLLLSAVSAAMGLNNIKSENQLAITGALLIASVVVNDLIARLWRTRR